jgi:hypothetical protein
MDGRTSASASTTIIAPTVTLISATNTASTPAPTFTATPIPFPTLTLKPGENYFSIDGKPGFIFSRNISGYEQDHYGTFLDWMKNGGSKLARIQLDSLGMGYTSTGGVDEKWDAQWKRVFDKAEADGIYILPVFSG